MDKLSAQDALDYCLTNPDGLGAEELLERFPQYRDELQPLLALSSSIAQVTHQEPPPVPAERRTAMKARLQAAATQTSQSALAAPRSAIKQRAWWWTILRRPALAAGAMAALAVLVLWWAAAGALPDSPFYGVKIASENFMLNFAGDDAGRARTHLHLADIRLNDIRDMGGMERLGAAGPAIDNYDYHIGRCATLLERIGEARDEIAARLGQSMQRCDQMFRGFGASLDSIPEGAQAKIASLYKNMGDISAGIGITPPQPPQELPVPSVETPVSVQATATPVKDATSTAIAEATALSTLTAVVATETPVTLVTATLPIGEATITPQPATPTATAPGARPTATLIATNPTPRAITPTRTAVKLPLAIATPIPTRGNAVTPSPTRTSTAQPPPLPPLPPPPTNTSISQPPPPLPPPSATPTNAPVAENSCNLSAGEITFGCDDDGITWSAQVENQAGVAVAADWNAEIMLKVRRGSWQRLEESGAETFNPGSHTYGGEFSYDPSLDIEQVKVRLIIVETGKPNCRMDSHLTDINGCGGYVSLDRYKDKDK